MPENSGQEKTEPATSKRRQEARKKGQVARSPEISSAMVSDGFDGVFLFWRRLVVLESVGVYQRDLSEYRYLADLYYDRCQRLFCGCDL